MSSGRREQIPSDSLLQLWQRLDRLPRKSPERTAQVQASAELYGVSASTVYRALKDFLKPPVAVVTVGVGGRHPARSAQLLEAAGGLDGIRYRHSDVHQHHVRRFGPVSIDGGAAIAYVRDAVPLQLKEGYDGHSVGIAVVNAKNVHVQS